MDAWINLFHQLAEFECGLRVMFRRHLPRLISQPPVADAVRLLMAVLAAQIRVLGIRGSIAIFNPVSCFLRLAALQIDADVWFSSDFATVFYEFICPEAVTLWLIPSEVAVGGSGGLGPDPVFPVVRVGENPARPAQNRDTPL